jgi:putative tricarboxylic transport membrane protein
VESTLRTPVTILAGTPAGGGQDRVARAIGAALGVDAGVSNIPGRGGGNAWDALVHREGDASVVAVSSASLITNRLLGLAQIDHTDLTPVAMLATEHLAFGVGAGSSVEDPADLAAGLGSGSVVALATARGNINHIAVGTLAEAVGVSPADVDVRVFDSARHAVAEVCAGSADIVVVSAASVIPEVMTAALRIVAVSAPERLPAPFEDVATWTEAGFDCVAGTWRGLVGPPGLTSGDLAAWDRLVAAALVSKVWTDVLVEHRWTAMPMAARECAAFLEREADRLEYALVALGLIDG